MTETEARAFCTANKDGGDYMLKNKHLTTAYVEPEQEGA